jgi:NADP-dependent aldehyde dehydrogenase
MKLSGLNMLGSHNSGIGQKKYKAINPATLGVLDTEYIEATPEEIDRAVNMASEAFDAFRERSYKDRASFLEAIATEIMETGDSLIERCMEETALPEARLTGERMRTVNQLKLFASVLREGTWLDVRIDMAIPDRQPVPRPDIRQMRVALGPVGIFGASNFPLAFSVAGGDTTSALAAGCPVIVKAHPLHPGTSELVARAIKKAIKKSDMPDGIFSMIHGASKEVGMALVNHPEIRAVGFTGSFKGGKALFDSANARNVPIPVFAEMGSVNPVFILPNAMKERGESIAQGMLQSFTLGAGQFCTNPGLTISNASKDTDGFIKKIGELASDSAPGTMLSGEIKSNFMDWVRRFNSHAGVDQIVSGEGTLEGNKVQAKLFNTTGEVFMKNPDLAEEVFGPSTTMVSTSGRQEMISIAKKMEGQLTATIHGNEQDMEEYSDLIRVLELKVGRLIFNGYPTGVEVCHSMVHGGPFPATTASQSTSVGTAAIKRFSRPICYQDFPQSALPDALKDENPLGIWRMINGNITRNPV